MFYKGEGFNSVPGDIRSSVLWHLENRYLWGFLFLHHKSQDAIGRTSHDPDKQTHSFLSSGPRFAMTLYSH